VSRTSLLARSKGGGIGIAPREDVAADRRLGKEEIVSRLEKLLNQRHGRMFPGVEIQFGMVSFHYGKILSPFF